MIIKDMYFYCITIFADKIQESYRWKSTEHFTNRCILYHQ